jgi:predicted DsbA family dithiol-disulfide isomerase
MPYESTISFTLDTICPWTYLAKRRLDLALSQYAASPSSSKCTFTLKILPYQLYPEAPQAGEDKYAWYKKTRYSDSDERMKMYVTLMGAYGVACGIDFKFGGTVANTLHAHRVIGYFQEEKGVETAGRLVDSLYRQYFEEERHPSSEETLLRACEDAGISDEEAKRVVVEDDSKGMMEAKMAIREQAGNGIDSVPYIVLDGRRRDLTLVGAKEVEEYVKALETIAKESS